MRTPTLFLLAAVIGIAQDVEPLLRALDLKAAADARNAACRLTEARELYTKAATALHAPSKRTDADDAGRGKLRASVEVALNELGVHEQVIRDGQRTVAGYISRNLLQSARDAWNSYDGPHCDPDLGKQLDELIRQAADEAQKGDDEVNPRRRLAHYQAAFNRNSQTPGLYKRLAATRQQVDNLPCNGCRVAGKVVKRTVILGIIGGGAYIGWQQYDRHRRIR